MNTATRPLYIRLAMQLAERSDAFTCESRFQAYADRAEYLMKRAQRQQRASFRLLRWAGVCK